MKLLYIANIRLPTEKAHGAQIMKACEALAQSGIELELVVPKRKNPIKDEPFAYYNVKPVFKIVRLAAIDTVSWGRFGFILQSLMFAIKAAWHIRKREGIVYGRDEIVLAGIKFLTNRKIFWESHDGAWNIWARYLVRCGARVVVVTKGAADFYHERGVPGSDLLVVPNGIDLGDFMHQESQEAARKRLGLPLNKKIALYVGRLDGWKGTNTLLEASAMLPDDILVAVIGGEERQVQELKAKYPKVQFLGFRPYRELANNLSAGDFLILPNTGKIETSAQFTSPLKLFSYMAAGKPIVASDLSSIREILHDEDAIFFEADTRESLVEAIKKLAHEPELAHRLGENAHKEVGKYTWEKRAQTLHTFLEHHV